MKKNMHTETGSVDTEGGWVESYEAIELEEIDLTATILIDKQSKNNQKTRIHLQNYSIHK